MNYGPVVARLRDINAELVRLSEDLQLERRREYRPYDGTDHLGNAIDRVNGLHERIDFYIGHLNDIQRCP